MRTPDDIDVVTTGKVRWLGRGRTGVKVEMREALINLGGRRERRRLLCPLTEKGMQLLPLRRADILRPSSLDEARDEVLAP